MGQEQKRELIQAAKEQIRQADAVLIGAGSGLSTAAGLTYSGSRFEQYFAEYIDRYRMIDMYSAGFYPFQTQAEKWAYWSRHIYYNRYQPSAMDLYLELYNLVKDRCHFVLTTNVDHQFIKAGFSKEQLFATQGDYGLFQCKQACHKKLYDNETEVRAMINHQKDCKIPEFLIPRCPVCGGEMEVNLRCDQFFVEDESWYRAANRYQDFLDHYKHKKLLFLELGVGMNTPGIIKYPFWQMTHQWKQAKYICLNYGEAWAPADIKEKAICIDGDLKELLAELKGV